MIFEILKALESQKKLHSTIFRTTWSIWRTQTSHSTTKNGSKKQIYISFCQFIWWNSRSNSTSSCLNTSSPFRISSISSFCSFRSSKSRWRRATTRLLGKSDVSSSNPALFNDFLVLKILRGLRALRTLKTLWMFGGAQVIIVSIFKSMGRTIKNIGVILILAIWIFGKWSKFELAHFLKVFFDKRFFQKFWLINKPSWCTVRFPYQIIPKPSEKNGAASPPVFVILILKKIFSHLILANLFIMTTADGWFGLTERAEKAVGSSSTSFASSSTFIRWALFLDFTYYQIFQVLRWLRSHDVPFYHFQLVYRHQYCSGK